MTVHPDSVLLITLDSCRYDTAVNSNTANIRNLGPIHRAQAPSYFTFGSHAAMFMGFTPGMAEYRLPHLNPKYGKLFRLEGAGSKGKGEPGFLLRGRNIIEGFGALGYATIGAAAVGWFNPETPSGRVLTESFQEFFFAGNTWSLHRQLDWLRARLEENRGKRVFVFLNVGETHVPYYFEGAPWSARDNPCIPFQEIDRSAECRGRQKRCLEHVDAQLGLLLDAFMPATVLICGDHGDCWGEDGLWEHGVSHPATLTVPLIIRLRGVPLSVPTAAGIAT